MLDKALYYVNGLSDKALSDMISSREKLIGNADALVTMYSIRFSQAMRIIINTIQEREDKRLEYSLSK